MDAPEFLSQCFHFRRCVSQLSTLLINLHYLPKPLNLAFEDTVVILQWRQQLFCFGGKPFATLDRSCNLDLRSEGITLIAQLCQLGLSKSYSRNTWVRLQSKDVRCGT